MRSGPGAARRAATRLVTLVPLAMWQPDPARAQDAAAPGTVRLSSEGSGLAVEGRLLGYDGTFFRVETPAGPVTVDGARVRCTGDCPDAAVARIAISGEAGAADALLADLIAAFAAAEGFAAGRTPEGLALSRDGRLVLEIALRATVTEEGFADLLAGEADMVLARRPVRPLEAALARDAGLGDLSDPLRVRVLPGGALAAIVAPGNPVRSLTLPQLAAIFSGALDDWAELGLGGEGAVRLHLAGAEDATAQGFDDSVMVPAGLSLDEGSIERHADESALAAAVAADPGAIGIVRLAEVGPARALALGGGCAPAAAPTPFGIASGDYPLAAPLLLYLPAMPLPGPARDLAVWLGGEEASALARGEGGGRAAAPVPFDAQAGRIAAGVAMATETELPALKEAVAALAGHMRLPETFRFEEGSARLDAIGESDAARLAARLARGEFDGKRLLFAGFSDAPGEADARLSRLRAGVLRDHVVDLAGGPAAATLRAAGFGAALPVACSDTVWGRHANRRVELWIAEDEGLPAQGDVLEGDRAGRDGPSDGRGG